MNFPIALTRIMSFEFDQTVSSCCPTISVIFLVADTVKRIFFRSPRERRVIASINKAQLGSFPVPIPPIELQGRYARLAANACAALLIPPVPLLVGLQRSAPPSCPCLLRDGA